MAITLYTYIYIYIYYSVHAHTRLSGKLYEYKLVLNYGQFYTLFFTLTQQNENTNY